MMKASIRSNEERGKTIEAIIAEHIGAVLHDANVGINKELFDIRKGNDLIEVKSCRWRVQSRKGRNKTWFTKGRFDINLSSHEKLNIEAVRVKMIPKYIFVVYDLKNRNIVIVRQKFSSWSMVDNVLKMLPVYPRKDGMRHKMIPYKLIFPDML